MQVYGNFDGAYNIPLRRGGAGAVCMTSAGEPLFELAEPIGKATNNVAEFRALIILLENILGHPVFEEAEEFVLQGDSQLVVEIANKRWRCHKEHLKPLANQTWALIDKFKKQGKQISISWIGRDDNQYADRLSKQAMDEAMPALAPEPSKHERQHFESYNFCPNCGHKLKQDL